MLYTLKKRFDQNPAENSQLWRIIQDFYLNQGPKAWENNIPYTITNLAITARSHAEIILSQHDQKTPLTIVDYGAGIGQHGYYFAKALQQLAPHLDATVILADISPDCIAYWEQHPQLSALIRSGHVHITQLSDHAKDIAKLTKAYGPCVYILNYLIDSLPFSAIDQGLIQNLILSSPAKYIHQGSFTGKLTDLTLQFRCSGIKSTYSHSLHRQTIPVAGIQLIQMMYRSQSPLVIINDKGFTHQSHMHYNEIFNLDLEGCFSTDVNFPALIEHSPYSHHQTVGDPKTLIKTCVLSTKPYEINQLVCPNIASLIKHIKHNPINNTDQATAVAKLLQYDPFSLELMSQATSLNPQMALDQTIEKCIERIFIGPMQFHHLQAARIYRKTQQTDKSLYHLKQFDNLYGSHPALDFEYGIHFLRANPKQAYQHLLAAAKDAALYQSAQALLTAHFQYTE